MKDIKQIYSGSPLTKGVRGISQGGDHPEILLKTHFYKGNTLLSFLRKQESKVSLSPSKTDRKEICHPERKSLSRLRRERLDKFQRSIILLLLTLFLLPLTTQAQYFNVFDIDTSDYPTMRAKFYSIDENGKQILNHTPADFEITENGEQREVVDVSCPVQKNEPVSVVLAIDVSGSMGGQRIELAKEAARSWVKGMPEDESECAIISFTSSNNFIQDFTSNKNRLLNKINNLNAGGGTSFDAAFTNKMAGALLTMEKAKNNVKAVILISDGVAGGDGSNIINKASSIGSKVFSVTLDMNCPEILRNISENTGGNWHENVTTEQQARDVFSMISQEIQNDPCDIAWKSKYPCSKDIDVEFKNKLLNKSSINTYSLKESQTANLIIEPTFINFGEIDPGTSKDTTIQITSRNFDAEIYDIALSKGSDTYVFNETFPFTLKKGVTKDIIVTFEPDDSLRHFSTFNLLTDNCKNTLSLYGGYKNQDLYQKTLKLIHPNGGEVFYAGSDTVITWEGISKEDLMSLKFSSDNGRTWESITKKALNYSYNWLVPNIKTDEALISAFNKNQTNNDLGDVIWAETFGGSNDEISFSITELNDGYAIAGFSSSKNGDIKNLKGQASFWIVKVNLLGKIVWEKSYGGSRWDEAKTVEKTNNNGLIVAGTVYSSDLDVENDRGLADCWVVKLDKDGEVIWSKTYGTENSEEVKSLSKTSDGGYILSGKTITSTYGKIETINSWVIKIDENGKLKWEKILGDDDSSQIPNKVIETNNGNYIVVGLEEVARNKYSNKIPCGVAIKLGEKGNIIWKKNYCKSKGTFINSGIKTFNNEFVMTGFDNGDIWIFKIDSTGNLIWEKRYGGTGWEEPYSIISTTAGNYAILGYTGSTDGDVSKDIGDLDIWLLIIDKKGNKIFEKSFGGTNEDIGRDIIQALDGDFIITGDSQSKDHNFSKNKGGKDYFILKVNGNNIIQSDTSDAVFSIIAPEPRIQNNDIDLGQMVVGKTKDSSVTKLLCNDGEAPLHVLGVDITSGDDSDFLIPRGAGEFTLNEGECQNFMIEFTPSEVGNREAYATIRTTIGDFQDTIRIRGEGINPQLQVQADIVDFGEHELGNSKDTSVVLIENVGVDPITIKNMQITGPDKEQFEITDNERSFTLTPNEPKEISLRFTANYGGRTSSMLAFEYDGVDSPVEAVLYAEGIGGNVYPEIEDGYAGEVKDLKLQLGRIKPEGITEIASTFTATVKFNSTLIAPLDKSVFVEIDDENRSVLEVEGNLSNNTLLTSIPVKIGLGNSIKTSITVTDFQLYDENGDEVFYDIEPGIGEFNMLGICEEGGTRLINPNGRVSLDPPAPNMTNYQTDIRFETIESGHTKLEVYNFLGSKVATIINGDIEPGRREMTLDLSDFATGRYYIQLSTPTVTKTEILEVVK